MLAAMAAVLRPSVVTLPVLALGLEACWHGEFTEAVCCVPPSGNPACFPEDLIFTYDVCCVEAVERRRQEEPLGSEESKRDYEAMLESQRAAQRTQQVNPVSQESALTACEELAVLLWGVLEGRPIPVSDYQSWLSRTRHACPLIALTLRFAALGNERDWLWEFATEVKRGASRGGDEKLYEGTLWAWDLMITNVRWHALVDQAEIPLFQILHKVGQALQTLQTEKTDEFPEPYPARTKSNVGMFSRALEANERVPLLGALEVLNSEKWCSHLAMSAYVAIAEHMEHGEQLPMVDRVENCFREQNFLGSFGTYLTQNSPVWPLLARLGCSRGFCGPGA